jgi:O-succinylbenzoic acid--CoA ligase
MTAPYSLAGYLQRAAIAAPQALAVRSAGRSFGFAEWLNHAERLAGQIDTAERPVIRAGDSLLMASFATACSLVKKPFFAFHAEKPADRSISLPGEELHPDTALIISTSGSEGQPRAVLLGNAQLDAAAAGANERLGLGAGDCWLNCLPLHHVGGQAILWRCARAGATVLLHDGFVAAAVAFDLATHAVTHISLVPAMLARLLDLGVQAPPSLRVALIGGAALSRQLYDKARAAGWPLVVSYGMSETAALIAAHAPGDGPWREGLAGRPLPGHELRIGDDGRIAIRGPQVMLGYADGSGVDSAGWLTTGDLGAIDADGRLSVLGRADDMLISGGCNVHPQEVEACLAACPGVDDVAVTGQPDPVWGDVVVALVVGPVEPADLFEYARRHLPKAAQPRRFHRVDQLPRNATGKLDRPALRLIVNRGR